ncbi:hypothetical protein Nepgr_008664 [Nepenthes gracilis]|uniref:Uncharacterized protein n=1 Tax=Nepenthes gracilis TaxID=150966 RepID=A0AAD3XJH6_NEPGR|nr:hypothetical protein Nepgr_008664 [Nepenthes gracilis]
MPSPYFPLRWESTGDKWWYASPIDWAAANGLYDLVRELLRQDSNHLIKLTSLRRIRRLEAVWDDDDDEQFHGVAKCRCEIARRLFDECESNKGGMNSLIGAGYGGWLLYTAASAGDLGFVQQLLKSDPLLVFGEGEYVVTDMLYAAARSKDPEMFRVVYDFAASPRFLTGNGRKLEEQIWKIPSTFKKEVMDRAVHAAARGGNLTVLKELLRDCDDDVLGYRDVHGSTILHAAAGKGQTEVLKYLLASSDIISSTDYDGNTALHVAAFKGQLSVVETLVIASPSHISIRNKAGNTFLHTAVAGFQTPGFRRLDRQIGLMKQLVSGGKVFNIEDIINVKNSQGRTALHMAIAGNVHSSLVELLMTAPRINVNICDDQGLTPLDYLRQQWQSSSSKILIGQMVSAGGLSSCQDYTVRKALVSYLRLQGSHSSPGRSFKILDTEMLLLTGLRNASNYTVNHRVKAGHYSSSSEASRCDSSNGGNSKPAKKKLGPVNIATKHLKTMLRWPKMKKNKPGRSTKDEGSYERRSGSKEIPVSLRQRFSKPTSLSNNKRTLSVRSNISSPANKKKFASGIVHGFLPNVPHMKIPARSSSSSFSKLLLSSRHSLDKGKGIVLEDDIVGPCSYEIDDDDDDSSSGNCRHGGRINKKLLN